MTKPYTMLSPRPVPFAGPFRGEERIEHLVEHVSGNAGPGIADRDHGVAARPDVAVRAGVVFVENDRPGFDDELAAIGHGVAGVEGEIEDSGGKLVGIDDCRACLAFKYRFDLDMLAERALQQLCGIDDQRIDVGFPGLERLLAGERQQMLGKVRAARCGFVDHPRDGGELRLALHGIGEDFDRSR